MGGEVVKCEVKEVTLGGVPLRIAGRPGDAYFDNLDSVTVEYCFLESILREYVRAGSTIIDVGANIGVSVAMAAALVSGARIIAIEPSPLAFACLKETIAINGLAGVTAINACISNDPVDTVAFTEMPGFLAGSHIVTDSHATHRPVDAMQVSARRLDDIVESLALSQVDFVKIDVEGAETAILDSMRRTNEHFTPLLFMEFNCYALTAFFNLSPRALLDRIRLDFGSVYYRTAAGNILSVTGKNEFLGLLHETMVRRGCVEDIMFSKDPNRLRPI